MTQLRDFEGTHEQPDTLQNGVEKGCVKFFEMLDECLGSHAGKRNLPLHHAVRPEAAAPAVACELCHGC